MLYREVIAVCSEIHTKHINTLCGQNVGFFFTLIYRCLQVNVESVLRSKHSVSVIKNQSVNAV